MLKEIGNNCYYLIANKCNNLSPREFLMEFPLYICIMHIDCGKTSNQNYEVKCKSVINNGKYRSLDK